MSPELQSIYDLVRVTSEAEVPLVLGGSLASGAWGHPRHTNDVDCILRMTRASVENFISLSSSTFMLDASVAGSVLDARDPWRSFQMLHTATMTRLDCFVPYDSAFIDSVFARAVVLELGGVAAPVLSAEDIVLFKLRGYELGNRVSDRQWRDITRVLAIQGSRLDFEYLERRADDFGLTQLLVAALDEVGRE